MSEHTEDETRAYRLIEPRPRRVTLPGDGPELLVDIYHPSRSIERRLRPLVLFISGYPDFSYRRAVGSSFRESTWAVNWCRLIADTGAVAAVYGPAEPTADARRVLRYLVDRGAELGVDVGRVAIWASSGHGPTALSLLTWKAELKPKCAVLWYTYLLDSDGATHASAGAHAYGFANPTEGLTVGDIHPGVPLMLVRAGRDNVPGILPGIDRFVASALARNLPLTLVNHAEGVHGFDAGDGLDRAPHIVDQALSFLWAHVAPGER